MLKEIYAKISKKEKTKRMTHTFSSYFKPDKEERESVEQYLAKQLIEKMQNNTKEAEAYRKVRIYQQIDKAIARGQEKYYYLAKDKEIIDDYIMDKFEAAKSIIFIEEEN